MKKADTASKLKSVNYCYPSSSGATKFGFAKSGCYAVALGDDIKPHKLIAGFKTFGEAQAHAETLPNGWSRFTMTAKDQPQARHEARQQRRLAGAERSSDN